MTNGLNFIYISIFVLLFINIFALIQIYALNKKIKSFKKTNLPQNVSKEIEEYLMKIDSDMKSCIHNIKLIRFNAYKGSGTGSNQSFALSLLDFEKNGVIISSLYSRDQVRVYAKKIDKGVSSIELSEEENELLKLS